MRAALLFLAPTLVLACGTGSSPGTGGGSTGGGGADAGTGTGGTADAGSGSGAGPDAGGGGAPDAGGGGSADAGGSGGSSDAGTGGSDAGSAGGGSASLAFTVTDLGRSVVRSVDARGRVAGFTCTDSGPPCVGAVYTRGSGWAAVPVPDGASDADAVGISADGSVGLNARFPFFLRSSYLRAYTASPLRPLPTASHVPQNTLINAVHPTTGHIVGFDEALGGAFLYDGKVTPIAVVPGRTFEGGGPSQATALNAHDQVAGWMRTTLGPSPFNDTPTHAFFWDSGKLTDLGGGSGACEAAATGINNAGVVVGWTDNGDRCGRPQMFIWDGQMHVRGCPDGTANCRPAAINARGDIVGSALVDVLHPQRGFLYRDGAWHDLQDLVVDGAGWVFSEPVSINDAGEIAGNGTLNRVQRAFLISPR